MQPSGVKTLIPAINKINKNVQPHYLKEVLRTATRDECLQCCTLFFPILLSHYITSAFNKPTQSFTLSHILQRRQININTRWEFTKYLHKKKILPPTLELYATPTPHLLLSACIAISPAHLVPCLWRTQKKMFPCLYMFWTALCPRYFIACTKWFDT